MSLVCLGTVGYLSLKWTKEALLTAAYGKRRRPRLRREGGPSDPLRRTRRARWRLKERTLGSEGLAVSGLQAQLLTLFLKETVIHRRL